MAHRPGWCVLSHGGALAPVATWFFGRTARAQQTQLLARFH